MGERGFEMLLLAKIPESFGQAGGRFHYVVLFGIVAICYGPWMTQELPELEFRRFWQRLQAMGLNAYEARSYLVLVGHPRFKALELAARAHVPRQKIYEVLDSLVEKGFAQVIQEKTKLFSAVEPGLALPSYLSRRSQGLQQELLEQSRLADGLMEDLSSAYSEGQGGRGTLDFLR